MRVIWESEQHNIGARGVNVDVMARTGVQVWAHKHCFFGIKPTLYATRITHPD